VKGSPYTTGDLTPRDLCGLRVIVSPSEKGVPSCPRKRFAAEQIITKLREADVSLLFSMRSETENLRNVDGIKRIEDTADRWGPAEAPTPGDGARGATKRTNSPRANFLIGGGPLWAWPLDAPI
jgi:hypothetical protein